MRPFSFLSPGQTVAYTEGKRQRGRFRKHWTRMCAGSFTGGIFMLQWIGEIILSIFFVFGVYCAFLEIWRCIVKNIQRRQKTDEKIDNSIPEKYNKEKTSASKE